MSKVKITGITDPGETTDDNTNEDYLWISQEHNTVFILDGTSGTRADFGSEKGKTGGRNYVEKFTQNVKNTLENAPETNLEDLLKTAVSRTWDDFEEIAAEKRKKYFSGEKTAYPTSETVPGAVGCIVKWTDEEVKVVHVGDVETFVVKKNEMDFFCNKVHQKFDEIYEEKIKELRENGVENPSENKEVLKLVNQHRSASSMPGTYPQLQFNPLVIEKQGRKKKYSRKNVEKIVLGTDGATTRIRELYDLKKDEVPDFIEKKGVKQSIEDLREKEDGQNLDKLKNSDDAAIALIEFSK